MLSNADAAAYPGFNTPCNPCIILTGYELGISTDPALLLDGDLDSNTTEWMLGINSSLTNPELLLPAGSTVTLNLTFVSPLPVDVLHMIGIRAMDKSDKRR